MTTSYKGHNDVPHFEGLWAPVEEKENCQRALLFLGDCYLIFFEYLAATREFTFSSQTYVVEEDRIIMTSMLEDADVSEIQVLHWRITDDMLIEIEQDGASSVWEPVLIETLAEEGFPTIAIERYREVYGKNGIPHSTIGVAPYVLPKRASKQPKDQEE
ncbi:MAG: hypothetical protein U1F37_16935 [Alphaproteobacteria bacterium]